MPRSSSSTPWTTSPSSNGSATAPRDRPELPGLLSLTEQSRRSYRRVARGDGINALRRRVPSDAAGGPTRPCHALRWTGRGWYVGLPRRPACAEADSHNDVHAGSATISSSACSSGPLNRQLARSKASSVGPSQRGNAV